MLWFASGYWFFGQDLQDVLDGLVGDFIWRVNGEIRCHKVRARDPVVDGTGGPIHLLKARM